jgi:hypothetical protein
MTDLEKTAAPETAIAEQRAETWLERIAEFKIADVDGFRLVGEWLREIKKVVDTFDLETAPEIKKAYDLHKSLIARRNKWAAKFEEADKLAREKLKHYFEQQSQAGIDLPKIEGISFPDTWTGEVVDASLIPKEYLTPDTDKLKAITKALKEATNIPGWKAKSVKSIAVRL